MRFVAKPLNSYPLILKRQATLDLLLEIIRTASPDIIAKNLYQDSYRDAQGKNQMHVRDALNVFYHHKCAYCESLCKAEIEHYRPKAAVTGEGIGYYWLCYEWSNLIPSCHECNASGGKGNRFPVRGQRTVPPTLEADGTIGSLDFLAGQSPLIDEDPYLLHPEIDDPDRFLGVAFDPTGKGVDLLGLDGADQRGERTIEICNLNRTDLKLKRLKSLKFFVNGVNALFAFAMAGQLDSASLIEAMNLQFEQMDDNKVDETSEHTLVLRYVMQTPINFRNVILPLFEPSQRQIIHAAFEKYCLQRIP